MKKILPIVVLLVLALALAAWLLRPRGAASNSVNTIRDHAAIVDAGKPLQGKLEPGVDGSAARPVSRDPVASADEAAPKGVGVPSLHVPDYGPWLQRGGAKVQFELFDALGARVQVGAFGSIRVRRKLGRYFATEDAFREFPSNVLVTGGLGVKGGDYTGLEPGQYVLEADSSRWGALQHEFSVQRGEERTERITLSHFERVACFRFVHEDGTPVAWLPAAPSVHYATVRTETTLGHARPVLRNVPGEPDRSAGNKFWSASPSGVLLSVNKGMVVATDEGRWYVRVVSGREATVKFTLDEEVWGVRDYTVTGTFEGAEWAEHTVRLSTPPGYIEYVNSCQQQGLQDPGERSLLTGPAPVVAADPLNDPVAETEARLLVQVQCNIPVKVVGTPNRSSTTHDFTPHPSGWFLDVPRGQFVRCGATDSRWFTSDGWEMDPAHGGLVQESRVIIAPLMRVDLRGLSPTLRAYPVGVQLSLDPRKPRQPGDEFGEAEESNVARTVTGIFATRGADFVDVPWGGGIFGNSNGWTHVEVQAGLSGGARLMRPRSGSSSLDPEGRTVFEPKVLGLPPVKLPMQDGFATAAAAGVKLECPPMLVLRATGDQGEGLPWVEATLLRLEDDALCRSIRESFAQSYPAFLATGAEHAAALATEDNARDAALAALIGEEAASLLTTREQREWFARHGAWYNTGSRLWTQEHGYMFHDAALEPGQIYVLYLWSNSRDDLSPDKRIVFRASEGVTDLGVITLPSYRD